MVRGMIKAVEEEDGEGMIPPKDSHINHVTILRVYHGRHPQGSRPHQHIEHLTIAQLHRRICHVQLDAGNPFALHHERQLVLQDRFRWPRQDQMESVVDVALTGGSSVVLFHDGQQRDIIALLRRKCQDRRIAPGESRSRATEPFVPCRRIILMQVYM